MSTQSVYIADDVSYVTGTVNNVSCTWTMTADHIWSTVVDTASDGIYNIDIIAVDAVGNQTNYKTVAYEGLHLIIDRTQQDVDLWNELRVKSYLSEMTTDEQSTWSTDLKGAYNVSDLNRVGAAVEYLANLLNTYGYTVVTHAKITYIEIDTPSLTQMTNYLSDVKAIKEKMNGTQEMPETMNNLSYEDANNIEKVLYQINNFIQNMIK